MPTKPHTRGPGSICTAKADAGRLGYASGGLGTEAHRRSCFTPPEAASAPYSGQASYFKPKTPASTESPDRTMPQSKHWMRSAVARDEQKHPPLRVDADHYMRAATSRRSLEACIAPFPLLSFLMSKAYFKSDHLNGGGSSPIEECPVACIGLGSGPIHLGPVDFFRMTKKRDETIAMRAMTNVP